MSKIKEITENAAYYGGVSLAQRAREYHTPAVSVALIENFEISAVFTHGAKRRAGKDMVTADTLFQAASISKPVFAVAVMRLVERGALDLDADISQYLPGFELPKLDGNARKITLRLLLSHHAGLNLHGFAGYQKGQKIPTLEQMLSGAPPANSLALKMVAEPGTAFSYSGGGYNLATKVVLSVCKREFDEIMRELVFGPFGMKLSTYAQPLPGNRHGEIAFGYNSYDLQLPGGFNTMPELSAAGLWTTPSELARLGIEMMRALKGESAHIKKNTAEIMTTKFDESSPVGVGFFVTQCKKGFTFGHGGDNGGYHSNMTFCPTDGSGIVVMQNADIGRAVVVETVAAYKDAFGL